MPSGTTNKGNPLWRQLSRKLLALREQLGLTTKEMSLQLGIAVPTLDMVLFGGFMPPPPLAARLKQWAFGHVTYERAPKLRTRARNAKINRWPGWRQTMPVRLLARIDAKATSLGMSRAAFTHVALARLLADTPTLTSFRAVTERVEEARVAQLLGENPDIADLLESDAALAKLVWDETPLRYAESLEECTDGQILADMVVEEGPAVRIGHRDLEPV